MGPAPSRAAPWQNDPKEKQTSSLCLLHLSCWKALWQKIMQEHPARIFLMGWPARELLVGAPELGACGCVASSVSVITSALAQLGKQRSKNQVGVRTALGKGASNTAQTYSPITLSKLLKQPCSDECCELFLLGRKLSRKQRKARSREHGCACVCVCAQGELLAHRTLARSTVGQSTLCRILTIAEPTAGVCVLSRSSAQGTRPLQVTGYFLDCPYSATHYE